VVGVSKDKTVRGVPRALNEILEELCKGPEFSAVSFRKLKVRKYVFGWTTKRASDGYFYALKFRVKGGALELVKWKGFSREELAKTRSWLWMRKALRRLAKKRSRRWMIKRWDPSKSVWRGCE